jgi:hypothetical protein
MTERALPVYAFDRWTVKPGNEAAFVVAWTALIDWTLYAVPGLVGRQGRLLQDIARSSDVVCPLAWESAAALKARRRAAPCSADAGQSPDGFWGSGNPVRSLRMLAFIASGSETLGAGGRS